jgi:hypothetical protein
LSSGALPADVEHPLGNAVDRAALVAQIVDASLTAAPGW